MQVMLVGCELMSRAGVTNAEWVSSKAVLCHFYAGLFGVYKGLSETSFLKLLRRVIWKLCCLNVGFTSQCASCY